MDLYDGVLDSDELGGWAAVSSGKKLDESGASLSTAAKALGAGFKAFKPRATSSSSAKLAKAHGPAGASAPSSSSSSSFSSSSGGESSRPPQQQPPSLLQQEAARDEEDEEDEEEEAYDPADAYVPGRPSDYLAYCRERLDAIRAARLERQNAKLLAKRERQIERERGEGGAMRNVQSGARGINQLPAWMQQQQQQQQQQQLQLQEEEEAEQ